MAIRDRATVTLKSGEKFSLTVTKQGGTLFVDEPRNYSQGMLVIQEQDSSTPKRNLRSLTISAPDVAALLLDVEPPEAKPKRSRKTSRTQTASPSE